MPVCKFYVGTKYYFHNVYKVLIIMLALGIPKKPGLSFKAQIAIQDNAHVKLSSSSYILISFRKAECGGEMFAN